jgi:hypothetical protein
VSRTQIAWRLGYADALQGSEPRVCELCPDVRPAELEAYSNGHSSGVGVGGFGSELSPLVALRRAVAAETIQEVQ